jgi:MraZ protein
MLRGNVLAKVDSKGRLKLPSAHRSVIEPRYGNEFFVTSIRCESVLVYPLEIFSSIEERLAGASKLEPVLNRYRSALGYYGQSAVMDPQGRILIHPLLREKAAIRGEVAVIGKQDHLEIWNRNVFEEMLTNDPLTDADLKELASFGF